MKININNFKKKSEYTCSLDYGEKATDEYVALRMQCIKSIA